MSEYLLNSPRWKGSKTLSEWTCDGCKWDFFTNYADTPTYCPWCGHNEQDKVSS